MRYALLLSPAIEEDVAAVAEYYGEIGPELAERFADELQRTDGSDARPGSTVNVP